MFVFVISFPFISENNTWKVSFMVFFYQSAMSYVCGFCCSGRLLQNWALCQPSFEPNSINSQKKLTMGKVQIYNRHKKNFSDTAQYFHSKHLKNGPKPREKHVFFFNGMEFQGPKGIFLNSLQASPPCQLNQTYRFIIFDPESSFLFIKSIFKKFYLVNPLNTAGLS